MLELILLETYVIAVCALIFVFFKLRRAYTRYRFKAADQIKDASSLPSVSVCLPARNETNAMTECLESVLASDYPKLEVIVLDDNSSDNTSHLIRAFAHAGVRFIEGGPLPSDWLGKNFALQTLLDNASGKYVLFMDVDTRLAPTTISSIINLMAQEQLVMSSVIPQRYDTGRASSVFSSLRYFWEIVLDRDIRPGSSSAAWMIQRRALTDELGGFGKWRDEVQPEGGIAYEMAKTGDYRLIVSTPSLGVHYAKKWQSQVETARRTLLPRFYNSIISVLIGIGLLCLVIAPQIIIIVAAIEGAWLVFWAQCVVGILSVMAFAYYCRLAWRDKWWIGLFVAPYIAWQELFLLFSSIIGYQLGTITWKGRKVERPTRRRLGIIQELKP